MSIISLHGLQITQAQKRVSQCELQVLAGTRIRVILGARGGFGISDRVVGSKKWRSRCGLRKVRERWWCSVRRFPWLVVGH
jgi:hypothetical protein